MWNQIRSWKKSLEDGAAHREAERLNRESIRGHGIAPLAKIAINAIPVSGSWGGGNQWLLQLSRYLRYLGYEVVYHLDGDDIDCIFIMHSSERLGGTFGLNEIAEYKKRNPGVRCVHRINENDARKHTGHMDLDISRINDLADYTVFISDWLRAYHAEKWFSEKRPHRVIINGADSRYFHPLGGAIWAPGEPMRLVTHHWSDHWNKGFRTYQEVDRLIAEGSLTDTELWIVGRWPEEINWQAARQIAPCSGPELAKTLRSAHVYITASLAEPGGMHFIEGLQCGLPLLYHEGGGGIVEVGAASGGIGFNSNVASAISSMRSRYLEIRGSTIRNSPTGERMVNEYASLLRQILSER